MSVPVTGAQYEIAAGPYRATVVESGAGLRELSHSGRPLVLSYDADEPAPAAFGQLLIPWPNRIDHGRYTYGGASYHLDISEPARDTAIHGLVRFDRFVIVRHEPHRVTLTHRLLGRPGYPFCLDLEVDYSLDPTAGLVVRITAANAGRRPAPYGHGAHPYLTVGRPIGECRVTISAARRLLTDDREIPTGAFEDTAGTSYDFRTARVLGDTEFNHAFTGLDRDADGRAWVRLEGGSRTVALWMDEAHPWLQVYTADEVAEPYRRSGLAAEPMTCPPNAFATGTDVIDLKPAEVTSGTWGIVAG